LKSVLLDQRFLAGIGNIYADESLHAAGLHPLTAADRLIRANRSAYGRLSAAS
jgi:formamidopyrimidine-DNA glycosylase